MQHEITKAIPLLDAQGNLTEAGYCRKLLPVYERSAVKGGFARLKEWDYYYVGNERFGLDPDVVAMADEVVEIPSHGMKNSLNVVSAFAVAAAFFRFRDRRSARAAHAREGRRP